MVILCHRYMFIFLILDVYIQLAYNRTSKLKTYLARKMKLKTLLYIGCDYHSKLFKTKLS
jgi:hypothetical protein